MMLAGLARRQQRLLLRLSTASECGLLLKICGGLTDHRLLNITAAAAVVSITGHRATPTVGGGGWCPEALYYRDNSTQ